MSFTTRVSEDVPAGRGGGGNQPQLTLGIVRTGPDVVCVSVDPTVYDQSQAMIVPGAVDVLPSNVQSSVFPLFARVQVSVSVEPLTPKLAVATVGRVRERTRLFDAPPSDAVMVTSIVLPTVRVRRANGALVAPAGTVMVDATMTGSVPDKDTTAPFCGAAAVSVTVPVMVVPPTPAATSHEIYATVI